MAEIDNEVENQPVKSKRDMFSERLKTKYPDKEYADDEELFGQINDDYDQYDKDLAGKDEEIKGLKDERQGLVDMFDKDPRSAQFLSDMANGQDPWVSLIKRVGVDGLKEMLDEPDKLEEFAEANKDYIEREAKSKEMEQTAQDNLAETAQLLEDMANEGKYTEEQIDEAILFLRQVFEDALVGKYTREGIEMALKAINHESDVATARDEGKLEGRNEKIEEKLRKPVGDGVPQVGGSNNTPKPRFSGSILDLAEEA